MTAAAGRAGAQLDCAVGGDCDKASGAGRVAVGYAFSSLWGIEVAGAGTGRLTVGLDRGAGLEPGSGELALGAFVATASSRRGRFLITAKAGIATIKSRARYADFPTVDFTGITNKPVSVTAVGVRCHWK